MSKLSKPERRRRMALRKSKRKEHHRDRLLSNNANWQPFRNNYLDTPASGRVDPDKVKIKRWLWEE